MDNNSDASLSSLVNSAITDAQTLVRDQIELAKAEVSQSAKQAAAASGLFIVAAVLAFLAFIFALVAGAYGLVAAGLPVWAGFLIVAGTLVLVALILALAGRSRVKKVQPPVRAIDQVERTKVALAGITDGTTVPAGTAVEVSRTEVASKVP